MSAITTIKEKVSNAWYGAGAAVTMFMIANPALADESKGIANLYKNTWTDQMKSVVKVVSGGSFVVGIVLIAGGLMKLKAAVDSQGQQVKYGDGLWRLALGSALCALPVVAGVGKGTLVGGATGNSELFDGQTWKVDQQ